MQSTNHKGFEPLNKAYNHTFQQGRLSLGLVVPIESYPHSAVPNMNHHIERVQLAESLGFSAVWLRDVPFNVPSFGDAGQIYDPFVYLGLLAGTTKHISLGVASIVLPLRHPAHVAKAAASADALSEGRLLLGVASGDRPEEYPALNLPFHSRGERFRESFEYIQQMASSQAQVENSYGRLNGDIDMLPKPNSGQLPMFITGASQQSPEWIAQHGHGWITYPRNITTQASILNQWRSNLATYNQPDKPAIQSLYIDLVEDDDASPQPIHLGFRSGIKHLLSYLKSLEEIGINHVALNLRFNQANIEHTLERIAQEILPHLNSQ